MNPPVWLVFLDLLPLRTNATKFPLLFDTVVGGITGTLCSVHVCCAKPDVVHGFTAEYLGNWNENADVNDLIIFLRSLESLLFFPMTWLNSPDPENNSCWSINIFTVKWNICDRYFFCFDLRCSFVSRNPRIRFILQGALCLHSLRKEPEYSVFVSGLAVISESVKSKKNSSFARENLADQHFVLRPVSSVLGNNLNVLRTGGRLDRQPLQRWASLLAPLDPGLRGYTSKVDFHFSRGRSCQAISGWVVRESFWTTDIQDSLNLWMTQTKLMPGSHHTSKIYFEPRQCEKTTFLLGYHYNRVFILSMLM